MKTNLRIAFIGMFLWMSTAANGQWINSFTILPVNPTPTDTITILADCSFPSAGCSDHTQYVSILGNDIYAGALHCLGVLTVICNYTDTFKINPLPAGSYTFHFQVDAGFGPSPCTPGIVPGPNDSIVFIVNPATSLDEFINQDEIFAFPNPAKDVIQVQGLNENDFPAEMELRSIEGKVVKSIKLKTAGQTVDIRELPAAVYQLYLNTNQNRHLVIQLVKN